MIANQSLGSVPVQWEQVSPARYGGSWQGVTGCSARVSEQVRVLSEDFAASGLMRAYLFRLHYLGALANQSAVLGSAPVQWEQVSPGQRDRLQRPEGLLVPVRSASAGRDRLQRSGFRACPCGKGVRL
jgi:hypothetical protein